MASELPGVPRGEEETARELDIEALIEAYQQTDARRHHSGLVDTVARFATAEAAVPSLSYLANSSAYLHSARGCDVTSSREVIRKSSRRLRLGLDALGGIS
jgi:hypothetical protein